MPSAPTIAEKFNTNRLP